MKLLFDQNLSPRLVQILKDLYPGSDHVQRLGLDRSSDDAVWNHARDNGFVIVTKDEDFNQLSVIRGFPPKIVWIQSGNCTTDQIVASLTDNQLRLEEFNGHEDLGTIVIR